MGYDHHPLIASYSEPIIASTDAVLESMAGDNAAYQQFISSVPTTSASTSSYAGMSSSELLPRGNTSYGGGGGMPVLPVDEFPTRHFGFEVKPPPPPPPPGLEAVSSPATAGGVYQDHQDAALQASSSAMEQQPSSPQDMEARRTKRQEKRLEAKQRYKDKKKNRRYVCMQAINLDSEVHRSSSGGMRDEDFAIAFFAGSASRSCTCPGRYEQTRETE